MEEKWLPAEHTLTWRVELNPDEARIELRNGFKYGVERVSLMYRRAADEVNEWEEPVVTLTLDRQIAKRGRFVTLPSLNLPEIPLWLAEIEARAQPANP